MNEIKKLLEGVNFDRITMKVDAETLKDVLRRTRAVNPQLLRDVIQKAIDGATEPELLRFILDHQTNTPTSSQRLANQGGLDQMSHDDFLRALTDPPAISFCDDDDKSYADDQRSIEDIGHDDFLRMLTNPSVNCFE